MITPENTFDVTPSVANHFAWIRTQLGLQRTVLAAVRTSVSLIGFGFTVAQFFEKMVAKTPDGMREISFDAPRNLGLLLIAAGVVSLAMFTWQYRSAMQYLRSGELRSLSSGNEKPMHTSTYVVCFVVMFMGLAAFVSVFLHF